MKAIEMQIFNTTGYFSTLCDEMMRSVASFNSQNE